MRAWEISSEMYLSLPETRRLLESVRTAGASLLDRVIVECLLFSGLRCSELCRLRLADFVRHTQGAQLAVRGREGAVRNVWLPPRQAALIDAYLVQTAKPERASNDSLLLTERRRPFDRTALYRRVVRVLGRAGLAERASVQLLRHTYGYLAYLLTGGNLLFVQRQLGHAHPMITAVYARLVDEPYDALAAHIGDLVECVTQAREKEPCPESTACTPAS